MSVDSVKSSSSSDRYNHVSDRNKTKDTSKTNSTKKTDKTNDVDKSKSSKSTDKSKEIDTKDKTQISDEAEDNKNSETKNMDKGAKAQADRILGSINSSFDNDDEDDNASDLKDVKSGLSKAKTVSSHLSNSNAPAGAALENYERAKISDKFGDVEGVDENKLADSVVKSDQKVFNGVGKGLGVATSGIALKIDNDDLNNAKSQLQSAKAEYDNKNISKEEYDALVKQYTEQQDKANVHQIRDSYNFVKSGKDFTKVLGKETGEQVVEGSGKVLLKGADQVVSPAFSAYDGYHEAKDVAKKENLTGVDKRRLEISGAAGAAVGDIAASLVGGAIAGSVVPGPGNVVGAIAGLGVGIAASTFGSKAGMSLGIDAGLKEAEHHKYEEIGNRMGEDAAKQAERILAEYNKK